MEIFEVECSRIGSGRIFPDHIENQDWIGYHGTSSYYSVEIESAGFYQAKPISISDIGFVVSLMDREGIDSSGPKGFGEMPSISFSPISELSLAYCGPSALGGQGVGFVKSGIDDLLNHHGQSLSAEESIRLKTIGSKIDEIRRSEPVVYAVNLQGLSRIEYQNIPAGVYVYEPVSRERIIAKLSINKTVDFDAIDKVKHRDALRKIFWSGNDHYIKRIKH